MRARTITAFFLLFLIMGSGEALPGQPEAKQQKPPEQDAGWNLGHTRSIRELDFSPDGNLIVSCGEDHSIRLWDAQTGALVRTLAPGHGQPFFARFTPDGRAILAGFENGTLGLWSVPEGNPLTVVRAPDLGPFNILWTPDGSEFVTTTSKGAIVVWSRDLRPLRTFPTGVPTVDFSGLISQGRVIVCTGWHPKKTVSPFALDLKTGKKVHGWFESKQIQGLSFSPDERYAVSEESEERRNLRNAATGAILSKGIIGQQGRVLFSRSGKKALLIGFIKQYSSHTGRLLSTTTWKPLGPQFDAEYVGVRALSPDGSVAAFVDGQRENRFRLFSTTNGKILWASADPFLILGSKPSLPLLQQLSEDYARYGLPEPPDSAKLAYVEPLGPPRTRPKEPADRILALVEPAGKEGQKGRWYAGFKPDTVGDEQGVAFVKPEKATLKRTQRGYTVLGFSDASDIYMAVFCYRRGWTELGIEFLKRKLEDYRSDVREEFADIAWRYWENALIEPSTDRNIAARYLNLLSNTFQRLKTDHNRSLLADLALTLNSPEAKRTGIEGEIDALSDAAFGGSYGWTTRSIRGFDKMAPALRSLWLRGFEAVPYLLRHVDDRRLAHGEMTGMNMYPTHITRVGEVVSKLLFALAGNYKIEGDRSLSVELELANRKSAEQWWERAKAIGEERYLLENIMPARDSEQEWPNSHNAVILAHKYPEKLPGVYEALLKRYPRAEKWEIAELLVRSKTSQAEKERMLVRAATTGDRDQRIGGFSALVKMKYPKTLDLVIVRLNSLPSKPVGAYWLGEASALGQVVQKLDEPRGWKALERLARRSDAGQRLEILGTLGNVEAKGQRKRHRIEFLAKFLNDNTLCDFSKDTDAFAGPHAHFDLKKITVRDAVLRDLSYEVGVRHYPREDWKPEDWAAWRPEVLAALSRYLKQAPGKK